MKPWRIRTEVEEEFEHAFGYQELRETGRGRKLLLDYRATLEGLQNGTESFSHEPNTVRAEGIFRARLKHFKYAIIFIEHPHEYEVISFSHMHRAPKYWRRRQGQRDE